MRSTRTLRVGSRAILFGVLAIALVLLLPVWPHSRSWTYYPGLLTALVMVGLLGLMLFRITPRHM